MKIAVPLETSPFEHRVAASPDTVKKYRAAGIDVTVQSGAGVASDISDEAFQNAGAGIALDFAATVDEADIVLKVAAPTDAEISLIKKGTVLIADIGALTHKDTVLKIAKAGLTCFAMDLIPRISRAQSMDVLSSQMNLAGYKAVIDAVAVYKRVVPLMMTAAGTVPAARVLVLGAGVAGLQAIATAKRLGAVVCAFDVRPSAREQVESLGAKFVAVDDAEAQDTASGYAKEMSDEYKKRQAEAIAEQIKKADIVISTALIPGKKAPVLVTRAMVESMRDGSVIFDLAAPAGGNCELTVAGQSVNIGGVTVLGYVNVPSRLAATASLLYAKNLYAFTELISDKTTRSLKIDMNDDIIKTTCIVYNGEIIAPIFKEEVS